MGKVIKKKLNGMSWWMKTSLVLLLTMATTMFMYQGWYQPRQVQAAVAMSPTWSILGSSTTTIANLPAMTLAKPATTNRLLVVSFVGDYGTALTTFQPTITYGGQALTRITSTDTSSRQKVWIGYLNDAGIQAATTTTFAVSGVAPDTGCGLSAAVYDGVLQSAPISGSRAVSSDTATTTPTSGTIPVTAGGWAIYSLMTNAATAVNASQPAGYTEHFDTANGTLYMFTMGSGTMGTTGTTNPLPVWTSVRYAFLTASIEPAPASTGGTLAVSTATQTVAEAVGNATISVTRTGGTTGAVTVDYATADGTALAGQDYTSSAGTLSWAAGDATAKTITVPITNDTFDDLGSETFAVNLTNATNGASLGAATQTVTITDDDATPTIGFTAATASGSRLVTPAAIAVNLSSVSGLATSVNYATSNGTALAGTDYTATSGTLNIPALSSGGVINVPISATSTGGKTFTITLTAPTNAGNGIMSQVFTITAAASTTITTCGGCHGHPDGPNALADSATRTGGSFQGSHDKHVSVALDCATCHTNPTRLDHSDGSININAATTISGGTYSGGSTVAVSNVVSRTFTTSCSGTSCHSAVYSTAAGVSPNWGTAGGGCGACHKTEGTSLGTFQTTGPGTGAPNTGGHNMHMPQTTNGCSDCHAGATASSYVSANHGTGQINVSTGYNLGTNVATKRAAGGTYYTCNNASCHSNPYAAGALTTGVWGTGTGGCGACHTAAGAFISYSASVKGNLGNPQQSGPNTGSHSGHMNYGKYVCAECHAGALTGSTGGNKHGNGFINVTGSRGIYLPAGIAKHPIGTYSATGCANACHMGVGGTANPIWNSLLLGCIDCHNAAITRTKGRPGTTLAAVKAEFGLAWGHKRGAASTLGARLAVTDQDCIVCHLEGHGVSRKTSNFHADGNIDLRDPDIQGETPITNISGTAFTFARFSTSYAAGTRTATGHTSNTDIANVISQKFCLKCHDANGATNTTARSSVGSASMPFGGTQDANYTVVNGAIAGGLANVAGQLATTNRSRHPVTGPRFSDFPTAARVADPYKPVGTRGTSGTANRSNSVVMNCFDCHNVVGTPLTRRTVVAHGNAVTVRGVATVTGTPAATTNETTLCNVCHLTYRSTAQFHGAGSAWASSGNNTHTAFVEFGCNKCHASGFDTAVPRPIRGQDTHGSNTLGAVGTLNTTVGRWLTDPTPVALIRNRQLFGRHAPLAMAAAGANPAWAGGTQCMNGTVGSCTRAGEVYTTGGNY